MLRGRTHRALSFFLVSSSDLFLIRKIELREGFNLVACIAFEAPIRYRSEPVTIKTDIRVTFLPTIGTASIFIYPLHDKFSPWFDLLAFMASCNCYRIRVAFCALSIFLVSSSDLFLIRKIELREGFDLVARIALEAPIRYSSELLWLAAVALKVLQLVCCD